jgi:hypothetical protein
MSFDKMNAFVDEHTILMRDFLRNISTLSEADYRAMQEQIHQHTIPIVTLTPQTPKTLKFAPLPAESGGATITDDDDDGGNCNDDEDSDLYLQQQHQRHHKSAVAKKASILINHEVNYDLDLIDLGKQLSILHTLLVTILAGVDEATKKQKFDQELLDTLVELTEMKRVDVRTGLAQFMQLESNNSNAATVVSHAPPHGRLYSYENRLHQAIMTGKSNASNSSGPSTPTTPPPQQLLTTEGGKEMASGSRVTSTSSSSSSKNSSQLALNDNASVLSNVAIATGSIATNTNKPLSKVFTCFTNSLLINF